MKRIRGFTLLELLLVLALVAAASLLAMAAFGGGMQGIRMRTAAHDVAAQLRFTRAVAIRSGTSQEFLLEPQARRWRAAHGRKGQLPETGTLTFTGARELQPASGVGAIRFFPDGAASGGRILICRTCLEHYGLLGRVPETEIGNMLMIVEAQATAAKVITL